MISKTVLIDKALLDIIVAQAKKCLAVCTDADYKNITTIQNSSSKLTSYHYTAMLNVYGKLDFMTMMSFEEDVIKNIANVFLDGESIAKNEEKEIYDSIASETVNIIMGSSLPFFGNKGEGIDIETPNIIDDIKIRKYDNMIIFSENLITKFGKLSISIIK